MKRLPRVKKKDKLKNFTNLKATLVFHRLQWVHAIQHRKNTRCPVGPRKCAEEKAIAQSYQKSANSTPSPPNIHNCRLC